MSPRDLLEDIRTTRRSIEARMVADSTKDAVTGPEHTCEQVGRMCTRNGV